jgi:rubrerythrin
MAAGLRLEQVRRPERRELVCPGCGYGVVVSHEPEQCPMCHGSSWRPRTRTAPLGRASELDPIAA